MAVLHKCKRAGLRAMLLDELAKANCSAGSRVPTVRKLAERWKVSPVTVSRLLNDMAEDGTLCREPGRGYFLKKDFPAVPRIGYLGNLPPARGSVREYIHDDALRGLFEEMAHLQIEPEIFSYADFARRKHPPVKLDTLNGILVDGAVWDKLVAKNLADFKGLVVMFDNEAEVVEDIYLPFSKVSVDYRQALKEFFEKHYQVQESVNYMIVSGGHRNARLATAEIRRYLAKYGAKKVEEMILPYGIMAEVTAYERFSELKQDWANTFIFSLSGYYSRGIYNALAKNSVMPDILSFDNLERHIKLPGRSDEYFTAIERNLTQAYVRAAQLLHEEIVANRNEEHFIRVNAELKIRKSIKNLK